VADLRGIDQHDAVAGGQGQPLQGRGLALPAGLRAEAAHGLLGAGALERLLQPGRLDRLEQVIDRADVEGLDGVLGVGGAEDHVGRRLGQHRHGLQPREARHLDVEEEHVDGAAGHLAQDLGAIAALARQLGAGDQTQQAHQAPPGQLLVVGHQHPQRHTITPGSGPAAGSDTVTRVRSPAGATCRRAAPP
jgi:hypothetical protein